MQIYIESSEFQNSSEFQFDEFWIQNGLVLKVLIIRDLWKSLDY